MKCRLQAKRQQLAPEVKRWQAYCKDAAALKERKLQLLKAAVATYNHEHVLAEQHVLIEESEAVEKQEQLEVKMAELKQALKQLGVAEAAHKAAKQRASKGIAVVQEGGKKLARLQAREESLIQAEAARDKKVTALTKARTAALKSTKQAQQALGQAETEVEQTKELLQPLQEAVAAMKQQVSEAPDPSSRPQAVLDAAAKLAQAQSVLHDVERQEKRASLQQMQASSRTQELLDAAANTDNVIAALQRKVEDQTSEIARLVPAIEAQRKEASSATSALDAARLYATEQQVQLQISNSIYRDLLAQEQQAAETMQQHGPGPLSMFDQAVAELWDQGQQGILPGFLGRLQSVAVLADGRLAQPVNAALSQAINLSKWVVVDSRQTALSGKVDKHPTWPVKMA